MLVRPATNEDAEAVFEMLGDFATSYVPERAAFDRSYPAIVARQEGELLVAGWLGTFSRPT